MTLSSVAFSRTDVPFELNNGRLFDTFSTRGTSELETLLTRQDGGDTLTPVESGMLARLLDNANPIAPADGGATAFADSVNPASDIGGLAAGDSAVSATAAPDVVATAPSTKSSADFTVTNGTAQDVTDLQQALDYLQSVKPDGTPVSPTAVELLSSLPEGAAINIVHNGKDRYDGAGVIDWDPHSGLITTSGQGTQSPALGLAHEVDHEVAGLPNPVDTHDAYGNTEEQRVIQGSETTIANDFHEPTRTDHDGGLENLGSSTDHTYWNDGVPPPFSPDIPGVDNSGDPGLGYGDLSYGAADVGSFGGGFEELAAE